MWVGRMSENLVLPETNEMAVMMMQMGLKVAKS